MKRQGGATVVTTGTDVEGVGELGATADGERPQEPGTDVSGTREPVTDVPVTEESAKDEPGQDEPASGAGRRRLRLVAGVLVVALLAAGGGLFAMGRQLRDTPATSNTALTDSEATTRVAGDVTNALGKVFSYSPSATAVTKESAKQLLAGKALQQYAALFGQVEKQAADQKLTLTTHVVRAGVTRLTHDSAHLLVFLDQVYERQGKAASTAAAQLSVTAQLRDGRWTIVEITSR
ncbi:Mce-associated membrane protein [Streptomyces sp. CEV 2-1]|uniref:hypothetical protein n=1 Tax=Streptomyces sp. CEV 2-1 TaxID=2485153 RepID=UPI000FB3136D|nr:hypothetical protein [Streptomyces sp. CEV 2-1]ROQ77426.1 Mce-associated membrane protein [Streptomyces sp. CEV 2-1]